MADQTQPVGKTGFVAPVGHTQIPYVVVRLPDGTLALRHPNELVKPAPAGGGEK